MSSPFGWQLSDGDVGEPKRAWVLDTTERGARPHAVGTGQPRVSTNHWAWQVVSLGDLSEAVSERRHREKETLRSTTVGAGRHHHECQRTLRGNFLHCSSEHSTVPVEISMKVPQKQNIELPCGPAGHRVGWPGRRGRREGWKLKQKQCFQGTLLKGHLLLVEMKSRDFSA